MELFAVDAEKALQIALAEVEFRGMGVTATPARAFFADYWCLVTAPEQTGELVREREEQALHRALAQVNASTARQILAKQRGRCAICGRRLGNKCHIDQIISLAARGSSYAKSNLQIVHPMCNYRKHANDMFVFTVITIRTDTPAIHEVVGGARNSHS